MKKLHFLSSIILGLSMSLVFSAAHAEAQKCTDNEVSNTGSYERFQCMIETVCKKGGWYNKDVLLTKVYEMPYPRIEQMYDANGLKKLKDALNKMGVKLEDNRVIGEDNRPISDPNEVFKISSDAYTATMNSMYRCAILNTKLNIGNSIIKTIKNPNASAITKRLTADAAKIKKLMTSYGCRNIDKKPSDSTAENKSTEAFSSGPEPSIKKELLSNTTYQYCTYRYYLSYLRDQYQNNLPAFVKGSKMKNTDDVQKELANGRSATENFLNNMSTAEKMASFIASNISRIDQENVRIRQVYKTALVAYGEFERTYGMHILLTFIYEDYRMLRDNLRSMLNPIGQVIYKIQNAQSKG